MWNDIPIDIRNMVLWFFSSRAHSFGFQLYFLLLGPRLTCTCKYQALTFAPHLNRLSRDCFYQLRQLRAVARSLSLGAATPLVHSFVTIRLGYCLSLSPSVPQASLSRVLR